MQFFDRIAPGRDPGEGAVELREVTDLDHEVEVAEFARTEPELAPGEPPAFDQPLLAEMTEIGGDMIAELAVARPGLEVAPDVIDVHRANPYSASGMAARGMIAPRYCIT